MENYKLILPAMGEGVMEATITKWLKKEGDLINQDDCVVEVATDKVDSDIISEKSGILLKIYKHVNEVAQIGEVIAEIQIKEDKKKIDKVVKKSFSSDKSFLSPLIKSIVKKENISNEELSSIQGSGLKGRITKSDLIEFLSKKNNFNYEESELKKNYNKLKFQTKPCKKIITSKVIISPNDEIIEMDRMRSLISNYMVESKKISPHVTSFIEADVTNLVLWKNKNNNIFFKKYSEKITFTPLFVHAIVKAIKDFPMINISVMENKIIKKKNINIGIATTLPSGNLIVPVIKYADQLSISNLAKEINNLVRKARSNKLKPSDIVEGTYTITNIGIFGNLMGTPIINQPQVAIMAIGVIQKKVSVLETITGDQVAIRHKIYLSHTYDHRVVDGSLGGMFLKRVSDYLENFDLNMKI